MATSQGDHKDAAKKTETSKTCVLDLVSLQLFTVSEPINISEVCRECGAEPESLVVGRTTGDHAEYFCFDTKKVDAALAAPWDPHAGDAVAARQQRALQHLCATAARMRDRCTATLAAVRSARAADAGPVRCAAYDALVGACAGVADALAQEVSRGRDAYTASLRAVDADVRAAQTLVHGGGSSSSSSGGGGGGARATLEALQHLARALAGARRVQTAAGALAGVQAVLDARVAPVWRACAELAQGLEAEAARRTGAGEGVARSIADLRARVGALLADAGAEAKTEAGALLARFDAATEQVDALFALEGSTHAAQQQQAEAEDAKRARDEAKAQLRETTFTLRSIGAALGETLPEEAEPGECAAAAFRGVNGLQRLCATQQQCLDVYKEEVAQFSRRYSEAEEARQRLDSNCVELMEKNKRLESEKERVKAESEQKLKRERDLRRKEDADQQSIKEGLRRINKDLDHQVAQLEQKNIVLERDSADLRGQVSRLEQENVVLQRKVDQLKQEKGTPEGDTDLHKQIDQLQQEKDALQRKVDQLEQEKKDQMIVFVLRPNTPGTRGRIYEAVNAGNLHLFLNSESLQAVADPDPPMVMARFILPPEEHTATFANPYGLQKGEKYWTCLCEILGQN